RVTNQARLVAHLVHDLVASVYTGAAADTHILKTVADVDTSRTDLDTQTAIDARPHPGFFVVDLAGPPAPGLPAYMVVRDHEGVVVHHDALEAGVGAHVFAHRFTQETGITPGRDRVEHHPEPLPRTQ